MLESDGMQTISSCPRCKGLIIKDKVLAESMYWVGMLRCINCGWIQLEEVLPYAIKTENRRTNKLDELQLYRTRSRGSKCDSDSVQYQ